MPEPLSVKRCLVFLEKLPRYWARHAPCRLCLVAAAALIGWTGDWHWVAELFSHAFFQYAVLSAALTLLLFWYRRGHWRWVALAVTLTIWVPVVPAWIPVKAEGASGLQGRLTLLQFNLFHQPEPLMKWLAQHPREIDLILLMEADSSLTPHMQALNRAFPYHIEQLVDGDPWGIALFSRYPFSKAAVVDLLELDLPTLEARVTTPNGEVRVVGIHPPNPITGGTAALRDGFMEKLAAHLSQDAGIPTVVLGDFNSTPWSPRLRAFLAKSGLADAQRGQGALSTWPAWLARYGDFFGVPIDMTLVSPSISVEERRAGPYLGSDHLPVITRIAY